MEFGAVVTDSILYGIAGALFTAPVLAFTNTVVRYLTGGNWRTDNEIGWVPW